MFKYFGATVTDDSRSVLENEIRNIVATSSLQNRIPSREIRTYLWKSERICVKPARSTHRWKTASMPFRLTICVGCYIVTIPHTIQTRTDGEIYRQKRTYDDTFKKYVAVVGSCDQMKGELG